MRLTVCPLSVGIFAASALWVTLEQRRRQKKSTYNNKQQYQVVFVLGGPGSGKGTQCQLLTERLKTKGEREWAHLSAGDLLRAERQKGGELGDLINARIAAGLLVPSEVTCKLIENAMHEIYDSEGITKFLIDGFPRSVGNADAWNATMAPPIANIAKVLSFECPEEVLTGRLLARATTSGRTDDNLAVIRKRFQTFVKEEGPIVRLYESQGKVSRIAADRPIEDIYAQVAECVKSL